MTTSTNSNRRIRPLVGVGVLLVAATVACGDVTWPSFPDIADLRGNTWDDTQQLPDGGVFVPLAGVRVEVLDGPKAGSFSISDAGGRYELRDMPAVTVQLRATKDGYDPATTTVTFVVGPEDLYPGYYQAPTFRLGAPPHTLWGDVTVVPSQVNRLADARIEVVSGPNAGKVTTSNQDGRYRFDDLVASPPFNMVTTKLGYQPRTVTVAHPPDSTDFRHNQQQNVALAPN